MILDSIHSPEDIRALDQNQLPQLCKELRQFLLENVSKTGGHFSSNLGVVELTVAIHRVFDTAHDRLVFDRGASGLRPQGPHRPSGAVFHTAAAGRPLRVS